MKAPQTIQALAEYASSQFKTDKRDNGDEFVFLKDGAPKWLHDMVRAAHGSDYGPDDYRYEFAEAAVRMFAEYEGEDIDEAIYEIEPDIYTGQLTHWLASNINRIAYCDEATEEYGPADISTTLMRGQLAERQEVATIVLAWLRDLIENPEEDDEAGDDEQTSPSN